MSCDLNLIDYQKRRTVVFSFRSASLASAALKSSPCPLTCLPLAQVDGQGRTPLLIICFANPDDSWRRACRLREARSILCDEKIALIYWREILYSLLVPSSALSLGV